MSDQEIYEIVERRIDQRNRRRLLWAVDLMGLILALAVLIASGSLSNSVYEDWAVAIFMAWGGVFTLHSILLWMKETRQKDIESEVARLRQTDYEKPKRLALSDEGELLDPNEAALEDEQRQRHLSIR